MATLTERADEIAVVVDENYWPCGPCLRVEYRKENQPIGVERYILSQRVKDHWVGIDERPAGQGHSLFDVGHTVAEARSQVHARAQDLAIKIGERYGLGVLCLASPDPPKPS